MFKMLFPSLDRLCLVLGLMCVYVNSQRRIRNGQLVPPKSKKEYMVYLIQAAPFDNHYDNWICGGCIVTESYILTSAACVMDVQYMYAIAGYSEYVTKEKIDKDQCTSKSKKKITYICVPSSYNFGYNFDRWTNIDIALVKVETPYTFGAKIDGCTWPLSAININYDTKYQAVGTDAVVYGWGHKNTWRLDIDGQRDRNTKKISYAKVKIGDIQECKKRYNHSDGQFNFTQFGIIMEKYMLCTDKLEGRINSEGEYEIHPNNTFTSHGCENNQLRIGHICLDITKQLHWIKTIKKKSTRSVHPHSRDLRRNKQFNEELYSMDSDKRHYRKRLVRRKIIRRIKRKGSTNGNGNTNHVLISVTDPKLFPTKVVLANEPKETGNRTSFREDEKNTTTTTTTTTTQPTTPRDSSREWLKKPGICQNDHGSPLVTWIGDNEYVIGVASVFRVSRTSHCIGPYLYTSTSCNGAFLKCILDFEAQNNTMKTETRRCNNLPSDINIFRREISWKGHPDGAAANELSHDVLERPQIPQKVVNT